MDNYQDEKPDPHYEAKQIAWGVALAVAGVNFALDVAASRSLDWITAIIAIAWGVVAWGITYALGIGAGYLLPVFDKSPDEDGRAAVPPQPVQVDQPEPTSNGYDDTPEWKDHLERHLIGGRLRVGNALVPLPGGFDEQWLRIVAKERWNGNLPTVSLTALHGVGISRFANGDAAPAALVLELFKTANLIISGGDRQPYQWTDAGERVFPSPPPPLFYGASRSVDRGDTTTTTTTTAAPRRHGNYRE